MEENKVVELELRFTLNELYGFRYVSVQWSGAWGKMHILKALIGSACHCRVKDF